MGKGEWVKAGIAAALLALVLGCGGKKQADSAADAAVQEGAWAGSLDPGTAVCLSEIAGVRYVIEDVLTELSLELADDCIGAEVELEEVGDAGAWELKYRAVGEKWQSCKSQEQERAGFLRECLGSLGAMVAESE